MPTGFFARTLLFGTLIFLLCAKSFGQGGPPLVTDDPGTPGNRHWEINTAFTDTRSALGTVYELPHLDLNYGYGDNVQLKLEGPLSLYRGMGDSFNTLGFNEWGVKWRFQEETKWKPAISTYPQVTFLSSNKLGQVGALDPGMDLYVPVEFLKSFGKLILDAELGIVFRQFTGSQYGMGVCAEYDITKHLALLGEVHNYASTDFHDNEPLWNLGFKQDFNEHVSLLFSAGRGFGLAAAGNPTFLCYLGVQLRI